MDLQRLKSLRKKQMIYLSISTSIITVILFLLIKLNISISKLFLLFSLLQCISIFSFVKWKAPSPISLLSREMRELIDYEKRKMGSEWNKQQRINLISNIFVLVMFLFQAFIHWNDGPFTQEIHFSLYGYLIFYFSIMALVLILQYFYNKKVDNTDDFSGFARNSTLVGIGIGIFLSYVIFILLIVIVVIND